MKVVVLAGGLSPERDVSLASGSLIANSLIKSGYEVMLLDLYLGTNNKNIESKYRNKETNELYEYYVSDTEPDLEKLREESNNGACLIGEGVLEICKEADVVFMALHGSIGENGKLQALFDIYGVNYTGTGYDGSMLAMDKDISKQLIKACGVKTAPWQKLDLNKNVDINTIETPCIIKPCSCGSSCGVSMVETKEELINALEYAKRYENNVLVEEKIIGREFSVGVFDGDTLPPIEIIPKAGFYDYKNKYQAGCTTEICPAEITKEQNRILREETLKVHKALRLGHYSRIDFILDKENNAYCLEANTLPGMTPTSLMPQEAQAAGMTYDELCERVVLSTQNKGVTKKRKF